MITARISEYSFCGCDLQLIGEKPYRVKITSQSPEWEVTTPIPKTCPFEALMLAELEILKAQIKSSLSPACVVQASRGVERIVGFNRGFARFSRCQLKKSAVDMEEYNQVLKLVKSDKKKTHLQLVSEDGSLVHFTVEIKRSSISVVNWLVCRAIT